jgi:hypothetical protein
MVMQQRNSSTPTQQRGGVVSGTALGKTFTRQFLGNSPLIQAKILAYARFSAAC